MSEGECDNCRRPQSDLNTALRRCARCRQVQYCSIECQRVDWPSHKRVCSSTGGSSDVRPRHRATCRMKFVGSDSSLSAGPEHEMIFFVRKTLRHLDDITIAGPFYPRQAMVEQIQYYVHKTSTAGTELVNDIAQDADSRQKLMHINAPLDEDSTKFIFVEVIEQHNPTMAARLPGPAYSLIKSLMMEKDEVTEREALFGRSPYPRIKESNVQGCFATLDEANKSGRELAASLRDEMPSATTIAGRTGAREFAAVVKSPRAGGGVTLIALQVAFDGGHVRRVS